MGLEPPQTGVGWEPSTGARAPGFPRNGGLILVSACPLLCCSLPRSGTTHQQSPLCAGMARVSGSWDPCGARLWVCFRARSGVRTDTVMDKGQGTGELRGAGSPDQK